MTKKYFFSLLRTLCLLTLFFLYCVSAFSQEIELQISRNEILNPKSKNELWLHIINHGSLGIRVFSFPNSAQMVYFLIDSHGKSVPFPRFAPPDRSHFVSNRKPFNISPGDTTGAILNVKKFGISEAGLFFLAFSIPGVSDEGIIVSPPYKLHISKEKAIETIEKVAINDLPSPVRLKFREEFLGFLGAARLTKASSSLPF